MRSKTPHSPSTTHTYPPPLSSLQLLPYHPQLSFNLLKKPKYSHLNHLHPLNVPDKNLMQPDAVCHWGTGLGVRVVEVEKSKRTKKSSRMSIPMPMEE